MDFPPVPSRRLRLAPVAALTLLLASPASADPLKEIGSSFDAAGRSLDRQMGEWFGATKPARAARRRALPATAPLPPVRPVEGEVAATPTLSAPTSSAPTSSAPAPEAPPPATGSAASLAAPPDAAANLPPTPAPAPDAVRTADLPAPTTPPRAEEKPTPQDRAQAERPTEQAGAARAEREPPAARAERSAPPPPDDAAMAPIPRPPVRPSGPPEPRVAALPPPAAPGESSPTAPSSAPKPTSLPDAAMPTVCPELSAEGLGEFEPVTVTATQPACAVDRGVSLSAVRMSDGRRVPLEPAAVLRCEMAASVARWLREEVAPATRTLGAELSAVTVAASQQCRPRNRVAGAKISEHGRGNAIDLRGLVLADGRRVVIGTPAANSREEAMPLAFQELLKRGACADFTTILGPGSDGYHEAHLHLDRAERRSGAVLCQWAIAAPKSAPPVPSGTNTEVPATPTPPPRPTDAPAAAPAP